jgi:hypothetical protein
MAAAPADQRLDTFDYKRLGYLTRPFCLKHSCIFPYGLMCSAFWLRGVRLNRNATGTAKAGP